MNCPLCIDEVLDATHRQGIEVDICPRCRGIWLDRGELDRLLGDTHPAPSHRAHGDPMASSDAPADTKKAKKKDKKRRLADLLEEVLDI